MTKRFFLPIIAVCMIAPIFVRADSTTDAAIDHVAAAIRNFYSPDGAGFAMKDANVPMPQVSEAEHFLSTLGADGSWPDIAYANRDRSVWPAAQHANRILILAAAANSAGAAERARIMAGIHRAFAFWIQHDFQCPNWWFNQIGVPKTFATAAILMGNDLAPNEKDYLLEKMMPRAKIGMTGQNRIWLAGNTLLFAVTARDPATIRTAADTIWAELRVSTKEGIQPDDSFHQHGPQQQFGNYGLAFAVEFSRWCSYLAGTPWAMPEEKLAIIRNYLLNGLSWVTWRGMFDPGACDRQIMPGRQRGKARSALGAIAQFAKIDPAHAAHYEAILADNKPDAPNDLVGDRYFYRSDALFHRLPDLFLSLKMSSNRVIGGETTNGENKLGYHAADGMLLAQRSGDEYTNIFPLWDWKTLPGVTDALTPLPKFGHTFVPVDFVGAASDGTHGVAAMNYVRDGVTAHKAWFFGNEGVLALGAGISSSSPAPVVTGVNSALLHGAVVASVAKGQPVRNGIVGTPGIVEHDGIRYTFPVAEKVSFTTNRVTGNWKEIFNNPSTPKADVSANVFSLTINHGTKPNNATYAYAIGLAGKAFGSVILQNTSKIQAARFDDGTIGIVFESAGTFSLTANSITADQACIVILDQKAKKLFVAEPTQKLEKLTITVSGKSYPITLPPGGKAGSTVSIPL